MVSSHLCGDLSQLHRNHMPHPCCACVTLDSVLTSLGFLIMSRVAAVRPLWRRNSARPSLWALRKEVTSICQHSFSQAPHTLASGGSRQHIATERGGGQRPRLPSLPAGGPKHLLICHHTALGLGCPIHKAGQCGW